VRVPDSSDHSSGPSKPSKPSNPRLRTLLGHEFFAPHQWKRRLVLWCGAVLVAPPHSSERDSDEQLGAFGIEIEVTRLAGLDR